MGVKGLWDLLTATALPVRVESLFGRVCCIDASFWISHCLASESNMRQGGDIMAVFFLRICYLLDKGIKPVFIFDGTPPYAKMKTLLKRKIARQMCDTNHKLLAYKLLASQVKRSLNYNKEKESESTYQPLGKVDEITPVEVDETDKLEESLFDVLEEEFVGDDYEKELEFIRDSDLSNRMKYKLLNSMRDKILQNDREEGIRLKDDIDEYSNYQINSYIKGVKLNREIEQIKSKISILPDHKQPDVEMSFKSDLSSEICDYNDYFNRKIFNNFDDIKCETVHYNHLDDQVLDFGKSKRLVDESVYATDEDIFGKSFLDSIQSDKPRETTATTTEKRDFKSPEKSITGLQNDYFLNLYKQHTKHLISSPSSPSLDDEMESDDSENYGHVEECLVTRKDQPGCENTVVQTIVKEQKNPYYDDIHNMLDLFGLPYLVAPSEAESQCAFMNSVDDCYAVISDDSDSLVFGAKRLLKNFYNAKVFELYGSDRIRRELGIGRKQFALIAVICGCDYTNGIKGIGIVNALEVIKAYPTFEDLYLFKEWATNDCNIETATFDECPIRRCYKKAHINYRVNWTFSPDFPNKEAYNIFLNPSVTHNYHLQWNDLNCEGLVNFMGEKSVMPIEQVRESLKFVMRKKSIQFMMEDLLPEIRAKPVVKRALKSYRIELNTNLSAFRKVIGKVNTKFNMNTSRLVESDRTLAKIRSKRMKDSIRIIRSQSNK